MSLEPSPAELVDAGNVGDADESVLLAARAAVATAARASKPWRAHPRRRRWALMLTTAAATVAVIGVPVVTISGHHAGAEANAAVFLRSVAVNAASGPDACAAAYWYSRSLVTPISEPLSDPKREVWIAHHGNGRLSQRLQLPLGPGVFPMGASSVNWDELCALPTDPGRLYATIREKIGSAGPDKDSETFTTIGDLLRESPAPPAVRAALYGAAAMVPGVRLVGEVSDAQGRSATSVGRRANGVDQRYLVDPATGRLLEEQVFTSDGKLMFRATYEAGGPVADDHTTIP
jgi:hypothetical protein